MLGVVVHTFNPSTREAEVGGFLSSRPAWSTKKRRRRRRSLILLCELMHLKLMQNITYDYSHNEDIHKIAYVIKCFSSELYFNREIIEKPLTCVLYYPK